MNANQFTDFWKSTLDFNQLIASQRRNIEAASEACQLLAESTQAMARRGAEVSRENVENALKASKEILTGGSPETSLSRQAEFARSIFEKGLANLREMTEMATKSSFEAFDTLNRRAAETMEEITKASGAASNPKRKNAA